MALNRYPWWKNLLIISAILLALIYALPNVFGEDSALQISAKHNGPLDQSIVDKITASLSAANIAYSGVDTENKQLVVRLVNPNAQGPAKELVKTALGDDYIVALYSAARTPAFLKDLGADQISLGLDLRGGVRFLMQVDLQSTLTKRMEGYANELRAGLRGEKIRYRSVLLQRDDSLQIMLSDAESKQEAQDYLRRHFPEFQISADGTQDNVALKVNLSEAAKKEALDFAIEQNMTSLRNRVDELGVAEAQVQRQGSNRISVELPGVQDPARAKEIIGKTATLEFLMVNNDVDVRTAMAGGVPADSKIVYEQETNRPWLLKRQVVLSGSSVVNARADVDQNSGRPAVSIRAGGNLSLFSKVTRENVGKQMATVYIETSFEEKQINGAVVRVPKQSEKIISVATINSGLGNSFIITGVGSQEDARNLALLLRSGALSAPVDIVEERTIGPSLGSDNIKMGVRSVVIGLVSVLLFMAAYYRFMGILADVALVANLIMLLAVLSLVGATLTLPGIAGIVLTLGMAVDANVLIFERIREELREGTSPQLAINAGYEKALVTILDANISTFIVGLVCFTIGSGPVKGFAVTLTIGLITSVFTAVMVSRMLVNWFYGGRTIKTVSVGISHKALGSSSSSLLV